MTRGLFVNGAIRRLALILAVGGLLAAAWLAAALASPQLNNLPVPPLRPAGSARPASVAPTGGQTGGQTSEATSPPPEQTEVQTPDERTGLITVLVLTGVLVAGGVAGWVLVRRRVRATAADPLLVARPGAARVTRRPDEVVAAVDAGLSELSDVDADPRRAVIACWVRLEQTAAAAGTGRHPGDSPTDLVSRLLLDHEVGHEALDDLAEVYREARYATHTIDDTMRAAAVAALGQIRTDLGRHRPAPTHGRVGPGTPGTPDQRRRGPARHPVGTGGAR